MGLFCNGEFLVPAVLTPVGLTDTFCLWCRCLFCHPSLRQCQLGQGTQDLHLHLFFTFCLQILINTFSAFHECLEEGDLVMHHCSGQLG